jgi:hypothetical protein
MDGPELEAEVTRRQDEADRQLRQDLLRTVLMPNLPFLRGGNAARWSEPGWCTALDVPALEQGQARLPTGHAHFPVPADCGFWYEPEQDPRDGTWFRFFYREAWLDMVLPSSGVLEVTVPFVVNAEAIDGLSAEIEGHRLPCRRRDADASGRQRLHLELPSGPQATLRTPRRIRFASPVTRVPAEVHAGSTDGRQLSLALAWPRAFGSDGSPWI